MIYILHWCDHHVMKYRWILLIVWFWTFQAIGEPPLLLSASVFFAIKEAIESARRDAGIKEKIFQLDSPATAERIRMSCTDQFTKQVPVQILKCNFEPPGHSVRGAHKNNWINRIMMTQCSVPWWQSNGETYRNFFRVFLNILIWDCPMV